MECLQKKLDYYKFSGKYPHDLKPNSFNYKIPENFLIIQDDSINRVHPGSLLNKAFFFPLFIAYKCSNIYVELFERIVIDSFDEDPVISTKTTIKSINPSFYSYYNSKTTIKPKLNPDFIFINVTIIYSTTEPHANFILVNIKTQTLYWIDPNGSLNWKHLNLLSFKNKKMSIQTFFKNYILKKYSITIKHFLFPIDSCPNLGPQSFNYSFQNLIVPVSHIFANADKKEHNKMKLFDKTHEIQGYCQVWCYFLIFLQCQCPHLNIKQIQRFVSYEKFWNFNIIRSFFYEFLKFKKKILNTKNLLQFIKTINKIFNNEMKLSFSSSPIKKFYPKMNYKFNNLPYNKNFNYYMKQNEAFNTLSPKSLKIASPTPKKPSPTPKYRNFKNCMKTPSLGGYSSTELKTIAKHLGIYKQGMTKKSICQLLKKPSPKKPSPKTPSPKKPSPKTPSPKTPSPKTPSPKTSSSYPKYLNFKYCMKTPSLGGYSSKELKTIAKELGIYKQGMTKKIICQLLKNI